jgi:hypothetical protein
MQSDIDSVSNNLLESEINNLMESFSDLSIDELKELLEGDQIKLDAKLDELINNSSMV